MPIVALSSGYAADSPFGRGVSAISGDGEGAKVLTDTTVETLSAKLTEGVFTVKVPPKPNSDHFHSS